MVDHATLRRAKPERFWRVAIGGITGITLQCRNSRQAHCLKRQARRTSRGYQHTGRSIKTPRIGDSAFSGRVGMRKMP